MPILKSYDYYLYNINKINPEYKFTKAMYEHFANIVKHFDAKDVIVDKYLNINCYDCKFCYCCINCENCIRCIDSIGCKDCFRCISCRNCIKCNNCNNYFFLQNKNHYKVPYTKKFKSFEYYAENIKKIFPKYKFDKGNYDSIKNFNYFKYSVIDEYLNIDCINCKKSCCCIKCIDCINCIECENCKELLDCYECTNCEESNNCEHCGECRKCDKCVNCGGLYGSSYKTGFNM